MPLFGDSEDHHGEDAATLAPISHARLEHALTTLEVNYGTDDDGDLVAGFDGNPCWFRVAGPGNDRIAFSFNARWKCTLPGEQFADALEAVNEWNVSQMFPRALCLQHESGEVIFGADVMHDFEFGVTDLQLHNDVSIAIATTVQYFEALAERFPGAEDALHPDGADDE